MKSYLKYVSDGNIALMQAYMGIRKVPFLKTPKFQQLVIEKEELEFLLNKSQNTWIGNWERMILILLFNSAARVSEISGILLGDLSLEISRPSIIIHEKGRKTRSIALSPKCVEHMKEYVRCYHRAEEPSEMPLFYTEINEKINHMLQRNIENCQKVW